MFYFRVLYTFQTAQVIHVKKQKQMQSPCLKPHRGYTFQMAENIIAAFFKILYCNIASDNEILAFSYINLMLHNKMINIANVLGSKGKDEAFGLSI